MLRAFLFESWAMKFQGACTGSRTIRGIQRGTSVEGLIFTRGRLALVSLAGGGAQALPPFTEGAPLVMNLHVSPARDSYHCVDTQDLYSPNRQQL